MIRRKLPVAAALAAAILACAAPARAVIKVDLPVSKMYDTSRAVVLGTVQAVNLENRVLDVRVTATPKGESPGDRVRVQIVSPPELLAQTAPGGPVVLFVAKERGGAVALLHLADAWLMAEQIPGAQPPAWRVVRTHDAKQTFPGRTAALVRVVEAIKAGKPSLLNAADPGVFRGGVRELANLRVSRPTFLVAADFSGDRKPDLVVGTAEGVRLFIASAAGYEDATEAWGLKGAAGAWAAAADLSGDGKTDLWLGRTVWINEGSRLAAAKAAPPPPDGHPAAVALADVTGDARPDALLLMPDGRALVFQAPPAPDQPWTARPPVTLWQGGPAPVAAAFGDWGDTGKPHVLVVRGGDITRYALEADGGPPADYARLTGETLAAGLKQRLGGLEQVAATVARSRGDARPDFFLMADGGGLLLVSRGFGAFFVNAGAGDGLKSAGAAPLRFTPATVWTAADLDGDGRDDLAIVTDDGRLYGVSNPAPGGKAAGTQP